MAQAKVIKNPETWSNHYISNIDKCVDLQNGKYSMKTNDEGMTVENINKKILQFNNSNKIQIYQKNVMITDPTNIMNIPPVNPKLFRKSKTANSSNSVPVVDFYDYSDEMSNVCFDTKLNFINDNSDLPYNQLVLSFSVYEPLSIPAQSVARCTTSYVIDFPDMGKGYALNKKMEIVSNNSSLPVSYPNFVIIVCVDASSEQPLEIGKSVFVDSEVYDFYDRTSLAVNFRNVSESLVEISGDIKLMLLGCRTENQMNTQTYYSIIDKSDTSDKKMRVFKKKSNNARRSVLNYKTLMDPRKSVLENGEMTFPLYPVKDTAYVEDPDQMPETNLSIKYTQPKNLSILFPVRRRYTVLSNIDTSLGYLTPNDACLPRLIYKEATDKINYDADNDRAEKSVYLNSSHSVVFIKDVVPIYIRMKSKAEASHIINLSGDKYACIESFKKLKDSIELFNESNDVIRKTFTSADTFMKSLDDKFMDSYGVTREDFYQVANFNKNIGQLETFKDNAHELAKILKRSPKEQFENGPKCKPLLFQRQVSAYVIDQSITKLLQKNEAEPEHKRFKRA